VTAPSTETGCANCPKVLRVVGDLPEYKEFNRQLLRDDLHDWSRTWWPSFRDRVEPEMRELAGRLGVEVPSLRQMVKDAAFTQ
jgi:hypothetical protein